MGVNIHTVHYRDKGNKLGQHQAFQEIIQERIEPTDDDLASDAELRAEVTAHGVKVTEEVDVRSVVERLGELYRSVMRPA